MAQPFCHPSISASPASSTVGHQPAPASTSSSTSSTTRPTSSRTRTATKSRCSATWTCGISLSQFIYQSDQPVLLGGKWGIDVIVPARPHRLGTRPHPGAERQRAGSRRHSRRALHPVGSDHGREWSHLHASHRAADHLPDRKVQGRPRAESRLELLLDQSLLGGHATSSRRAGRPALRIHYLWNSKNNQAEHDSVPRCGRRPGRPGHPPQLRLVLRGAAEAAPRRSERLLPEADHRRRGRREQGERHAEQVLGIGPGAVWHFSPDDHLWLNVYFETLAENRPEGIRANLRWTHHF